MAFFHPRLIVGGLALLGVVGPVHAAPANLCTTQEKPLFACALAPGGKLVSLCAPRAPGAAGAGPLAYRFGRPGRVELAYVHPYADFRFVHYSRFQVDRTEVSFDNGGYTYSVFDYADASDHPPEQRGVSVLKQGAASEGGGGQLACQGAVVSDLAGLESRLPCDRDNALSLGSCGP